MTTRTHEIPDEPGAEPAAGDEVRIEPPPAAPPDTPLEVKPALHERTVWRVCDALGVPALRLERLIARGFRVTDDEAIEACVDVIREVMHAWSRGDQRRAALRALSQSGGTVTDGMRAEIEAGQRAAWRRVRPALRALVEATREVER